MAHSPLAQMIGTYIFETRQDLEMTQKKLASLIGCSEQFMGRIEKGDVMIPRRLLTEAISVLSLKYEKIRKIYRMASEQEVDSLFNKNTRSKKSASA